MVAIKGPRQKRIGAGDAGVIGHEVQVGKQREKPIGDVGDGFGVFGGGAVYQKCGIRFEQASHGKGIAVCPCGAEGLGQVGDFLAWHRHG